MKLLGYCEVQSHLCNCKGILSLHVASEVLLHSSCFAFR